MHSKLKSIVRTSACMIFGMILGVVIVFGEYEVDLITRAMKNSVMGQYLLKNRPRNNPKIYRTTTAKRAVLCPPQDEAIIIAIFGQSNSANHLGTRFDGSEASILNYFEGKCYEAKDPLLGATGKGGNIGIPVALELKKTNPSKQIVLASFGVGATSIREWNDKKGLAPFLRRNLVEIKKTFESIDHFIWIQGESDHKIDTTIYTSALETLVGKLHDFFPGAMFALTSTTFCGGKEDNKLATAQYEYALRTPSVTWLGSTDEFNAWGDRWDGCHFSGTGAQRVATLIKSRL